MDYRQAIKNTIAYSNFFNFPLFPKEICFWLVTDHLVPFESIKDKIPRTTTAARRKRRELFKNTFPKVKLALDLTKRLSVIPGLLFVGLTGSVAAKNSQSIDDIDLILITSPHTLWLVRPLVLTLMSLFFRRRHPGDNPKLVANVFCPNLWLDTTSLSVPTSMRGLYTAHEILQIQPLLDKNNTYAQLLLANSWSATFLANAYQFRIKKSTPVAKTHLRHSGLDPESIQIKFLYLLLAPLNYLSYLAQLFYMSSKKTSEKVFLHGAFLHTVNYSDQLNSFLEQS